MSHHHNVHHIKGTSKQIKRLQKVLSHYIDRDTLEICLHLIVLSLSMVNWLLYLVLNFYHYYHHRSYCYYYYLPFSVLEIIIVAKSWYECLEGADYGWFWKSTNCLIVEFLRSSC